MWQNKTITRDFIYCPRWTGTALAGVKYTPRLYQRAVEFSRAVAKLMIKDLCGGDPGLVRSLADDPDLCGFNVAIVRAVTPPVWDSSGDILNYDGSREQVFSGHCTPVRVWRMADYLRKQADKLGGEV